MSTRAIIWFRGNENDANENGTWVFSHDGGDPRFVLKDLLEAHDRARTPRPSKVHPGSSYDDSWKIGRPGTAPRCSAGSIRPTSRWIPTG